MRLGRTAVFSLVAFLVTLLPDILLGFLMGRHVYDLATRADAAAVIFRLCVAVGTVINLVVVYLVFLRSLAERLWEHALAVCLVVVIGHAVLNASFAPSGYDVIAWPSVAKGVASAVLGVVLTMAARRKGAGLQDRRPS
jgi:hypothetical protein